MNEEKISTERREAPDSIRRMFNTIAPTYDLLNHVLSFGLDIRWRRAAVRLLEAKRGGSFLDIAAGSGDVSLDLRLLSPRSVVAADFALNMLNVFREKLDHRRTDLPVHLVASDALELPFRDGSFDGTIVAFGIRNFSDRLQSLREMLRVLKPGGISVILELTSPKTPILSHLYSAYGRWGLPMIGRLVSKDNSAYRYLPTSIASFPDRPEFLAMMGTAGFSTPKCLPLSLGIATVYSGTKGISRQA